MFLPLCLQTPPPLPKFVFGYQMLSSPDVLADVTLQQTQVVHVQCHRVEVADGILRTGIALFILQDHIASITKHVKYNVRRTFVLMEIHILFIALINVTFSLRTLVNYNISEYIPLLPSNHLTGN